MATLYDNITNQFGDGLNRVISEPGVKRLDFCVGYFNLRGWNVIADKVDELEGDYAYENDVKKFRKCRLLIGMQRPDEDILREYYSNRDELVDQEKVAQYKLQIARDFKHQLVLGLPNKDDEDTLRHLSSQLKDGKVCVKLYMKEPLHAKLYIAHLPNMMVGSYSILGSSNLTYPGMTRGGELNITVEDSDNKKKLADWFDDRWNDRLCIDITEELIKIIDESWAGADLPPYYIYLKTAYHLSQEARIGIKEFSLPLVFQRELFDFQQTAVKIAAKHLNNDKSKGAMIGDVVGLGKTITACAIAKIYEELYGSNTLIICPANLQTMWHKYIKDYDLKADVVSMSKPIDVDHERYHKLVIIDESHNLRNSNGKRYQNIKALIDHQECKVLLLTATPYNKDYTDLSNQLKLFVPEDYDLGIRPEEYIRTIGGERAFLQQHSEIFIRSIKAFEHSASPEDWQELMRLFLVRRTRSFIKENYAKTDPENGRRYLQFNDGRKSYFPERVPKAVKFKTIKGDQYSRLYSEDMITIMDSLKLPRYGLMNYLDKEKSSVATQTEQTILDNLSRAGERMMGFCKSTFFKRIDSSGFSFLLTLYRHILRNAVYIYAIDNKLPLPIGDENSLPDEYIDDQDASETILGSSKDGVIIDAKGSEIVFPTDLEFYKKKAKEYYELLNQKNNVAWLSSGYFKRTLKSQLIADCNKIISMIELCGPWKPADDQKLNELEKMLRDKHKNEKVLVFTQYSDTAEYIKAQLIKRGFNQVGCATGSSDDPTSLAIRFSPVSNEEEVPEANQFRILVATDVLSEGQNLQDSHVIINFDLPWAIIRLIQRAGRVDRIGQASEKILCYSFFPADGVEEIIKLRSRLNDRINENAQVVGSDEIFFEGNKQNLIDIYNEKNGSLDEEDDNDVDLSSQAYQIWKNATDANPSLKTIIPKLSNVVYSTKKVEEGEQDGVITYAKTYNDCDILTWYGADGEIITQSQKKILQAMACSADEPGIKQLDNHFELVSKSVTELQNMNTTSIGGMLGNRFSTRYRIVQLLENYRAQETTIFLDEEKKTNIKFALDDIYNYPLLDNAKLLLGSMLKKPNNDDIVDAILEMRKVGSLCRIDEDKNKHKDPTIICSMGLKHV